MVFEDISWATALLIAVMILITSEGIHNTDVTSREKESPYGSILTRNLSSSDGNPIQDTTNQGTSTMDFLSIPIYGGIFHWGYYFLDVYVGVPEQRFSAILDSASSYTVSTCNTCVRCGGHMDPPLDISLSETFEWMACDDDRCKSFCTENGHCGFKQFFTESSMISGDIYSDQVSIGDMFEKGVKFRYSNMGCVESENNHFLDQKVNGLFGFAPPPKKINPTMVEDIINKNIVTRAMVALCISDDGGMMTVGGYNGRYFRHKDHPEPIMWTNMELKNAYFIKLKSMVIDGVDISHSVAGFGNALLDTGTTFVYFPPDIYHAYREVIKAYCTVENGCRLQSATRCCWHAYNAEKLLDILPSFTMEFADGATSQWHPYSYLYPHPGNWWCESISANDEAGTVLGIPFFRHRQIIFDFHDPRLGISDADCPSFNFSDRKSVGEIFPGNQKKSVSSSTAPSENKDNAIYWGWSILLPVALFCILLILRCLIWVNQRLDILFIGNGDSSPISDAESSL